MKFFLACVACVLAAAVAKPGYGNIGNIDISGINGNKYGLAPAQPVGLFRVDRLVPAGQYASIAAPRVLNIQKSYDGLSKYGGQRAIDGEVMSLAQLALSMPTPAADVTYINNNGRAYGAGAALY